MNGYFFSKSVDQSRIWIVAFVFMLVEYRVYDSGGDMTKDEHVIGALSAMAVALLYAAGQQLRQSQSYLSRLVWIGTSFMAVATMWVLYQPFLEAVQYALVEKYRMEGLYTPELLGWMWIVKMPFFLLAFLLLANAVTAVVVTLRQINRELSCGVDSGVEPAARERAPVERVSSPPPIVEQYPLQTRDTQALVARYSFDDLAGNEELKDKLWSAAQDWNNHGKKNGKNGVLLYGPPGTGKTVFAEALAGETSLKIIKANVGSVASRWVNQTTEQMQALFDAALRQAPCVLFLDEVEALLPDRSRIERGDSEEVKAVAAFLAGVEKLRAGRVLVVAATNYKDRVDEAAIRQGRFDFHIEVGMPDAAARLGLIQNEIQRAGKTVEPFVLKRLVCRWAGFNVKRIQEAAQRGCGFAKTKEVGMADFMRGLRDVQGNKRGVPESALGLADLFFDAPIKARLQRLAVEFERSDEIEALGGQVSKGVIFYGPPGTGKTTMAQALAKDSGMTFIHTSGKKILSSERELQSIRDKALDLRPSIVFIDEADDILADRGTSGLKMHTNDLLATIDGAGEPLHDVVWVLATNSIDSLDKAVSRRFTTQIELPIPGIEAITDMVRTWAARADNTEGDKSLWVAEVATALLGLAPSVVRSVLDGAKNQAAVQSVLQGKPVQITLDMVLAARREMRA
ncbi:AAA family ATPase [Pulveribacter sp.]|uniref:AAA family ATPase n=1 Tax=Pulveribacter sp. TaxID=2678893 RepID=UPI0028AAD34F|nr:AAA family ATPase [Pulveribacter sp.]